MISKSIYILKTIINYDSNFLCLKKIITINYFNKTAFNKINKNNKLLKLIN